MIPTDGTGSFGPMRFVGRAGFSGGGCGPQCHRLVLHPGDPREQVVRRTRTGRGGFPLQPSALSRVRTG